MTFNTELHISQAIIFYEIVVLMLYYLYNINKRYLSWPIMINFYIIFVVLFCKCDGIMNKTYIYTWLFIKTVVLFWLLRIVDFSMKDYLISLFVLLVYFSFTNINKAYGCKVSRKCLSFTLFVSSCVYFFKLYNNNKLVRIALRLFTRR